MLLGKALEWSREIPLSIDDVELRMKNYALFTPLGPLGSSTDVDAIADNFFVTKTAKGKVSTKFTPRNGIEVHLFLAYAKYQEILAHIEGEDEVSRPPTISVIIPHDCLSGV
jgi:hypothetical protein